MNGADQEIIVLSLLSWASHNGRKFDWRVGERTNFQVLVTEYLLQRTNAWKMDTSIGRVFDRYKTFHDIAHSSGDELSTYLKPFGLYRVKSRRLMELSKKIVDSGRSIPDNYRELVDLPGVGDYTARAYLCFALKRREVLIDVNTMRIIGRVIYRLESASYEKTFEAMDRLLPEQDFVKFNLALFDFAANICRKKNPRCDICPISQHCRSKNHKSP